MGWKVVTQATEFLFYLPLLSTARGQSPRGRALAEMGIL